MRIILKINWYYIEGCEYGVYGGCAWYVW